jgi:hypothetical protein
MSKNRIISAKLMHFAILSLTLFIMAVTLVMGGKSAMPPTNAPVNSKPKLNYRPSLCLNGEWDFMPMDNLKLNYPPEGNWSGEKIRVPSPWNRFNSSYEGDWRAYRNFDYPEEWNKARAGWYRKYFFLPCPVKDPVREEGYRAKIRFDAVMHRCILYMNGKKAGENIDGYLPFEVDVTDALIPNSLNKLEVLVGENQKLDWLYLYPPGSWYAYNNLGIWQDVEIFSEPAAHLEDIFAKPSFRKKSLACEATLVNDSDQPCSYQLKASVREKDTTIKKFTRQEGVIPAHSVQTVELNLPWKNPHLWSPEDPHQYYLDSQLLLKKDANSKWIETDRKTIKFGFRESWIEGKFFYLNGMPIKLKVDGWHYMGPVQQNKEYARLWFKLIKETGGNTVRLHAMPYPSFYLDVADEMGMLVIDESAVYGSGGNLALKEKVFWDNARDHVRRLVKRDRNHPSVMIWSASNEIIWRGGEESFAPLLSLETAIKEMDPTRPVSFDENDCDMGGKASVYGGHYNDIAHWKSRPIKDKPFVINEFSQLFHADCHEASYWGGEEVYESFNNRLAAAGEEVKQMIWGFREMEAASFGPWNIVWYSLYPLPEKRHYLHWDYLEEPGMKPDIIQPQSLTLNYGFDSNLPPWRPNPVYRKIKEAYAPKAIHVAEENTRAFGGTTIDRHLYIFNDSFQESKFEVEWSLSQGGKNLHQEKFLCSLTPFGMLKETIKLPFPVVSQKEKVTFKATLKENGIKRNEDSRQFKVYPDIPKHPDKWPEQASTALLDDSGETLSVLNKMGYQVTRIQNLSEFDPDKYQTLIIGAGSLLEMPIKKLTEQPFLQTFMDKGGKVICLENSFNTNQGSLLKRIPIEAQYAHPVDSPQHILLEGCSPEDFRFWGKNEILTRQIYPRPDQGNCLSIVDVGERNNGLAYSALLEIQEGKGIILLNQLELVKHFADEPMAGVMLRKLLDYKPLAAMTVAKKFAISADTASALWKFMGNMKAAEAPLPPERFDLQHLPDIIMIDGQSVPLAEALLKKGDNFTNAIKEGKTLWLQEITPQTVDTYKKLLGFDILLTPLHEQNLCKEDYHPLLEGLNNSDFCWANISSGEDILHYAISVDSTIPQAPLVKTVDVKWATYASWAEQYKVGKVVRTMENFIGTKHGLVLVPYGKGTILFSQLALPDARLFDNRAKRISSRLMKNLGYFHPLDTDPLHTQIQPLINQEGYLQGWLACGPFTPADSKQLITQDFIGQEGMVLAREYMISGGKTWKKIFTNSNKLDLQDTTAFSNQGLASAYLETYLYSPVNREYAMYMPDKMYLWANYETGLKVWVNGEEMIVDKGLFPKDKSTQPVKIGPIKFFKGWNRILVKTGHLSGPWDFSMKIGFESGKPADDLVFSLEPPQ